jgi:hypothetical protein
VQKRAEQMFASIHSDNGGFGLVKESFENYYNLTHNACYMLVKIEYSTSIPVNIFELWDVNENRQIDSMHCFVWGIDDKAPAKVLEALLAEAHACQMGDFPGIAASVTQSLRRSVADFAGKGGDLYGTREVLNH